FSRSATLALKLFPSAQSCQSSCVLPGVNSLNVAIASSLGCSVLHQFFLEVSFNSNFCK
ncbi:hypothetical protein L9F63_024163, partial [Diploptera punctata]